MVSALAVRTLARRQWPLKSGSAAALSNEMRIAATPEQASNRCRWFDVFMGGRQQWAGRSVRPVTIPDRLILWRRLPLSSSSSQRGIISIELLQRQVTQLSSCRAKTFGGKWIVCRVWLSAKNQRKPRDGCGSMGAGDAVLAGAGGLGGSVSVAASGMAEPSSGNLTDSSKFDSYERQR